MIPKNAFVRGLMVVVALALAVGLLFASTRPVVAPAALTLTTQDEVAIYKEVIQAISPPVPSRPRYILRSTDDRAAKSTHETTGANSVTLSQATQDGLSAALGNVVWIDDFKQAALSGDAQSRRLLDDGSIITLGNITLQQNHKAKTSASVYRNMMNGAGYNYSLEWSNGVWTITEAQQNFIS
jgi:hypothetical protein